MKAEGNNNVARSRGTTGLATDNILSPLEIEVVDSDDEINSLERIVDRRQRLVVNELKKSFLLLNDIQMKHQQHNHYNGSVQISAAANNLSPWNDDGTDPYVRYIHSVHSLERQKAKNGSIVFDEKIGGVRKFATSIGNLLKSKQTNCQLNKLNEIQSPKPNKDRDADSIHNHSISESPSIPLQYHSDTNNIRFEIKINNDKDEPEFERPTTRQFERERRQAVREQTVRTKTFKQWNLADFTQGKSDYLEPRQRIESLRSLNSTPSTDVRTNACGSELFKKNNIGSSESFVPKEFCDNSNEFSKRYRLTNSNKSLLSGCVSPISDYSTWSNQLDYNRNIFFGLSSMDTLPGDGGVNNNNWFDVHKIKEAVSHESIANISQTRNRWQQMVDENQTSQNGSRSTTPASYRQTYSNRSTPIVMNKYSYGNHTSNGNGTAEPRSVQSMSPLNTIADQKSIEHQPNLDIYEKERLLFIAYIQSHAEVLASLGIIIPVHVKQKFPLVAQTRVELREIGYQNGNGYHHSSPDNEYYDSQSSRYGSDKSDLVNPVVNSNGSKNGRYIKHVTPSAASTTQRKIVRKQSNTEPSTVNGHNGTNGETVKKSWKLAQWMEPPPAINKSIDNVLTENGAGIHQHENTYRSTGESLIAREIREQREREEDLRRSRSELGLSTLDDVMDSWKYPRQDNGQQPSGLRSARSLDHLHIIVENGLQQHNGVELPKLQTRSGSMDHLHFAGNGDDDGRTYGVINQTSHMINGGSSNLSRPSPKSAYEKFLNSHSQNKFPKSSSDNNSNGSPRKQELNSIEARIEQELEEIRQREEELRRQREAAGLFAPNGHVAGNNSTSDIGEQNGQKIAGGDYNGHSNGFDVKPIYELHKMDNPDEMLFAPDVGSQSNQMTDGWMHIGDNRVKL